MEDTEERFCYNYYQFISSGFYLHIYVIVPCDTHLASMENVTLITDQIQNATMRASVLAVGILFCVLSVCVIFGNTLVIVSIHRFQRL